MPSSLGRAMNIYFYLLRFSHEERPHRITLRFVITPAGTSTATVSTVAFLAAVCLYRYPVVSETVSATATSRLPTAFTTFAFRAGSTEILVVYLEAVHRVHDTVGFSLFYLENEKLSRRYDRYEPWYTLINQLYKLRRCKLVCLSKLIKKRV